jgi:hypothetical protein
MAHRPEVTGRKYLRKRAVAIRYDVCERSIDRMAQDGRIPAPKYLPGSRLPLWDVTELDISDRRATTEKAASGASAGIKKRAGMAPKGQADLGPDFDDSIDI